MADTVKNCNNNKKGIMAVVIIVLAMFGSFATLWEIMSSELKNLQTDITAAKGSANDKIDSLEKNINDKITVLANALQSHTLLIGHPDMLARVVTSEEKLKEVETQFKGMLALSNTRANNEERLTQMLWMEIFGSELPPTTYWPKYGGD